MHSKSGLYRSARYRITICGEERVVIGSYHFVFEDEKCALPEDEEEKFESLPEDYSHLYHGNRRDRLAAVICIEDPLREEAPAVIKPAKRGWDSRSIVMMTGDSERTASGDREEGRRG